MSLKAVPLAEVASIVSGFAFKSNQFNSTGDGLPLIRIRDVTVGRSGTFYPGPYRDDFVVNDGDALIGMDGEFNLGIWRGGKALLNQRVCRVESTDDRLSQEYLVRFLPSALKEIEARTPFVTVKHLSIKELRAITVPLPALQEQRRIAAILDKADALRAKRREAIAKLDQLLQSVFLDMFGHPLSNERVWPLVRIADVCSPKQWPTITGKQLEPSGYPVYGANGVIGFYSSFNHEIPTVLVTCRGATCGTINVCEARSYVTGNAMALNDLDSTKVELDYMATMLRMRGVSEAITGAAQPQITRAKLSPVLIPLPPLSKQTRFSRITKAIADRRATLQEHANGLDRLFASTQHRAFIGNL